MASVDRFWPLEAVESAVSYPRACEEAVVVEEAQPPPPQAFRAEPADASSLLQACMLSLDSGNFIDTKFYAFSRRTKHGDVCAPKPIFASSWVLERKVPQYMKNLLSEDYGGNLTKGSLDGPFPGERDVLGATDSTLYESDSDLEDDDDDNDEEAAGNVQSNSSGLDPEVQVEQASTKRHGTGKIVVLRNFAYPTWKTLIYYLYSGKVAFSRLRSSNTQSAAAEDAGAQANNGPTVPTCSPKSMYKLADELDIKELKELAKKNLESQLSVENIMAELMSSFTSRYDEIREIEVTFACSQGRRALTKPGAPSLGSFPVDVLARNADVISRLVQILALTDSCGEILDIPGAGALPNSCASCGASGDAWMTCSSCGYFPGTGLTRPSPPRIAPRPQPVRSTVYAPASTWFRP